MRLSRFLIILFAGVFSLSLVQFGCSKNGAPTADDMDSVPVVIVHSADTTIFGTWYWILSQGGIAGMTLTPSKTGYTQIAILKRDSTYQYYQDNVLLRETKFSVREFPVAGSRDSVELMSFLDRPDTLFLRRIWLQGPDTLHMDDFNIADGFFNTYVRIGLAN